MENKPFTDTDNIPPAPDQVTKEIMEVQLPYLQSKGGDIPQGIEIGYRAAVEKSAGRFINATERTPTDGDKKFLKISGTYFVGYYDLKRDVFVSGWNFYEKQYVQWLDEEKIK